MPKVRLFDHHHHDPADRPPHAEQASRRHAPVLKLGIKSGSTYVKKTRDNTRELEKDERSTMIESSKGRREQDTTITEDKEDGLGSGGESSNRPEHTTITEDKEDGLGSGGESSNR